jgi:hypothetical protein
MRKYDNEHWEATEQEHYGEMREAILNGDLEGAQLAVANAIQARNNSSAANPYFAYTWAVDKNREGAFYTALSDLTIQMWAKEGRLPTDFEVRSLRFKFENASFELAASVTFDLMTLVPKGAFGAVSKTLMKLSKLLVLPEL